jgi:predicted RND superfamily exporter protein
MPKISDQRKAYLQSLSQEERNIIARYGQDMFNRLKELESETKEKQQIAIQESLSKREFPIVFDVEQFLKVKEFYEKEIQESKEIFESVQQTQIEEIKALDYKMLKMRVDLTRIEIDMENKKKDLEELRKSIEHDVEFAKFKTALVKHIKAKKAKKSQSQHTGV